MTADTVTRRDLIEQAHEDWTIRIYDDQPIADGKKYAADARVELLRNRTVVRTFLYPSYRIWTLLAHWTESLHDLGEALAAEQPAPAAAITQDRVDAIADELLEWAEGRRSHLNVFMSLEASPEHRQQTLVHVAQADAAEVQRLAAAPAVLRSEADR